MTLTASVQIPSVAIKQKLFLWYIIIVLLQSFCIYI